MLAWDYLTLRSRSDSRTAVRSSTPRLERLVRTRQWKFRDRGGIELSFPAALQSARALSFRLVLGVPIAL